MSLYRYQWDSNGGEDVPTDSTGNLEASMPTNESSSFAPVGPSSKPSFCLWLLLHTIGSTNIGVWDLALFVPNSIFMLFLLLLLRHSVRTLKRVQSPIYSTFFTLVFLTCGFALIRCIVTMSIPGFNTPQDQVLWLVSRFFQLVLELSVLLLAFLFGYLDSRSSTRRVLIITSTLALAYVCTQGALQQTVDKEYFHTKLYTHGGMQFWFASSVFFLLVYGIVVMLHLSHITKCWGNPIPQKSTFYYYAAFLFIINMLQAAGSSLVLFRNANAGFCLVDLTTFFYFSLFAPVAYVVFLGSVLWCGGDHNEHSPLLNVSYYPTMSQDTEDASVEKDNRQLKVRTQRSTSTDSTRIASSQLADNRMVSSSPLDIASLPDSEDVEQSYAFRTPVDRSENFSHILGVSYQSTGSLEFSEES